MLMIRQQPLSVTSRIHFRTSVALWLPKKDKYETYLKGVNEQVKKFDLPVQT